MSFSEMVVICLKFLIFASSNTTIERAMLKSIRCDLPKISYLCIVKHNQGCFDFRTSEVVICLKFLIFASSNTTRLQ